MDPETEARLRAVAERLKGKELFPESNARARAMLAGLNKGLPHQQFPELFGEKPGKDKKE